MGLDVADHQTNADLADAILAWGNEADEIAVGVGRTARGVQTVAGDDQLPIAGGQGIGQRRGDMVDLQDRAHEVVAVLVEARANLQQVVEGQADIPLPERQHGRQGIGRKTDIDRGFRQPRRHLRKAPTGRRHKPLWAGAIRSLWGDAPAGPLDDFNMQRYPGVRGHEVGGDGAGDGGGDREALGGRRGDAFRTDPLPPTLTRAEWVEIFGPKR